MSIEIHGKFLLGRLFLSKRNLLFSPFLPSVVLSYFQLPVNSNHNRGIGHLSFVEHKVLVENIICQLFDLFKIFVSLFSGFEVFLVFSADKRCNGFIKVFEWCPITGSRTLSQTQMVSNTQTRTSRHLD